MDAIVALPLIRERHKRLAPRIRVKCNPFAGRRPEFLGAKPRTSEDPVPAVVEAILEFGSKLDFKDCPFTDDPVANSLIVENSFAFLLAAALDRGATAERIWAIPYHLKEALGHLDPWKIKKMRAADLREVLRGLQSKPYYVEAASKTIVDVSTKVTEMYGGRAEAIWQDGTASEIHRRLDEIYGVGPGIASMIINLLVRWGRITVPDEHKRNIDVKPDVHVQRVMCRAGIAANESPESCVQGARIANPSYPGALDFPMWVIGRRWCHALIPACANCVISRACHKKGVVS